MSISNRPSSKGRKSGSFVLPSAQKNKPRLESKPVQVDASLILRIENLEAEIALLKQKIESPKQTQVALPWWEQRWGVFDNSPDYDKAMELGQKYRESLRPSPAKNGALEKTREAKKT